MLRIFLICFCLNLYAQPDLTIVGYIKPDDGLGKVPLNIIETLGDEVSSNYIGTNRQNEFPIDRNLMSEKVKSCLDNPDQEPGKVALLTDILWDLKGKRCAAVPKESLIKLAYSMLENTAIPKKWVELLNEEFDAVVVPDKYFVDVYQNCGVQIPIFVLPIPMKLKAYFAYSPHSSKQGKPFVFIDASANKNPFVLIEAFAKAFGNNPDVRLVMRAVRLAKLKDIKKLISHYGLSNIILENGPISLETFIDELSASDCYVNLSRGEGFSFIPREALALGLPVIITNNTASMTICESGFVTAVQSDIKGPSRAVYIRDFGEECGEQFDCRVEDVVPALQDMYYNYSLHVEKALEGRKWVAQYDCENPQLQLAYRTLVKPKQVELGDQNIIQDGTLITNSVRLFEKYKRL